MLNKTNHVNTVLLGKTDVPNMCGKTHCHNAVFFLDKCFVITF